MEKTAPSILFSKLISGSVKRLKLLLNTNDFFFLTNHHGGKHIKIRRASFQHYDYFLKEIMVKLKKTNTIDEKHYAIAVKLSVA